MGAIQPRRLLTTGLAPAAASTALGELLVNVADQKVFLQSTPVAGRGYLAKDVEWSPGQPAAALESYEFGQRVYLFAAQQNEAVVGWVRVPSAYTPGSPITLRVSGYSPGTSNNVRLQAVATLIRKGVQAVTATAFQRTITADAALTSTALQLTEFAFALSDTAGLVGAQAVAPGDQIQIVLSRATPAATEDTANDLRVVADNNSEVTFN